MTLLLNFCLQEFRCKLLFVNTVLAISEGKVMALIHISFSWLYRLRLSDGTCVFMLWHDHCGPEFFCDRYEKRPIESWWDNELICDQLKWFCDRGKVA